MPRRSPRHASLGALRSKPPQPPAPPLTPAQRWALACGAQLTLLNAGRHDTLSPEPTAGLAEWQEGPQRWWSAANPEELLAQSQRLGLSGHRATLGHEPLAWDLVRLINLTRWGLWGRIPD